MSTPSASCLFDHPEPHIGHTRTFINPILWFHDCDGHRVIFCCHEILYRVALHDSAHLALVAVTLRQSQLATQIEIATAFGHSVASQRRWETAYAQHGVAGLQPKSPTGRRAKLERGQRALVQRWFHQGVSNQEMARRLAVSEATIRRELQRAGLRRLPTPPPQLPLSDDTASPATPAATPVATPATEYAPAAVVPADELAPPATPAHPDAASTLPCPEGVGPPANPGPAGNASSQGFTIDCDPSDRSGDRALARQGLLHDAAPLFGDHEELPRAGVLLAVPVLQAHGGLEVFARLFGSLGPAFYGLRTTVLSLILLALLRIKRPENLKEYSPEQRTRPANHVASERWVQRGSARSSRRISRLTWSLCCEVLDYPASA